LELQPIIASCTSTSFFISCTITITLPKPKQLILPEKQETITKIT
jgi:hypothetical protein